MLTIDNVLLVPPDLLRDVGVGVAWFVCLFVCSTDVVVTIDRIR